MDIFIKSKEHVLITIFANSGSNSVYAVSIITMVKAFYRRKLHALAAFLLSQTTQVNFSSSFFSNVIYVCLYCVSGYDFKCFECEFSDTWIWVGWNVQKISCWFPLYVVAWQSGSGLSIQVLTFPISLIPITYGAESVKVRFLHIWDAAWVLLVVNNYVHILFEWLQGTWWMGNKTQGWPY